MRRASWVLWCMVACTQFTREVRADLKVFPPCFRGNKTHLLHNQPNVFWLHIAGTEVAGHSQVTIEVETDKLLDLYPFPETKLGKQITGEKCMYTFTGNPASVPGCITVAHQPAGTTARMQVTVLVQQKQVFQQAVDYTVLPELPLDAVPPRDFQLLYWSIADWRQTGKWIPTAIQEKMIDIMVKGLGYQHLSMYWGGDPDFCRMAKERGVKLILAQIGPFQATGVKDDAFPQEAVGVSAKGDKVVPILQWALTHPELLDRYGFGTYTALVKQDYCDGVNDDFELGGCIYNSVDNLTLAAFSQWSGIPRQELTPESLRSKYFADWTNFKVWQNAEYIRLYAAAIRRVKPNVKVYICAQPLPPARDETSFLAVQGVDPRFLDPYVDAHVPMMYMANRTFYEEVERTARGLRKPVIPLAQLAYGVAADNVVRSPEDVAMGFYSALTSGCAGYSFYDGTFAWGDGEYFHKLAAAWKQVQPLEEVFTRGCRAEDEIAVEVLPSAVTTFIDASGKKQTIAQGQADESVCWRAHRKGDRLVVSIFNFGPEAKFVKATAKRPWPVVYRVQGGKKLAKAESGTILKVASTAVTQVLYALSDDLLVRNKPVSDSDRATYLKSVTARQFPDERAGQVAIYGALTLERQAAVVLSIPESKLTIVPDDGGRIVSWKVNGREVAGFSRMERYAGGLGVDLFWYPATAGWQANEYGAPYQVEAAGIVAGVPQATVSRTLAKSELEGLKVAKTYRLIGRENLEVNHSFESTSGQPLTFSYWAHHQVQVPSMRDLHLPHLRQFRPVWAGPAGEQRANLDEKSLGEVFAFGDAPFTPGRESWEKNARQQVLSSARFSLESRLSPERVTVTVEKGKLLQFYSAFGAVPPTLEWMSRLVTLKPGEAWTVKETVRLSEVR